MDENTFEQFEGNAVINIFKKKKIRLKQENELNLKKNVHLNVTCVNRTPGKNVRMVPSSGDVCELQQGKKASFILVLNSNSFFIKRHRLWTCY